MNAQNIIHKLATDQDITEKEILLIFTEIIKQKLKQKLKQKIKIYKPPTATFFISTIINF